MPMPRNRDLLGCLFFFFFQRGDRETAQFRVQRTRGSHCVRDGWDCGPGAAVRASKRPRR